MQNKSNIIFIVPSHEWTFRFIEKAGFNVQDPYIGNRIIMRILREIAFRCNLPGKELWFNKQNLVQNKTIFVYEGLIIPTFIKWLHEKTINCKIILFYNNPVRKSVNPNLIDNNWCQKWTVDIEDVKKYDLNYYFGSGYFTEWKVEKTIPIFDIFYVGKDKARLEKIYNLQHEFERLGLKVYFHITAERRFGLKWKKIYKPFISYEEVLELLGKTKAILHLNDGCQKGITIRIVESLIHKIKLITDDQNIVNWDFYNSNNIFILGIDDINRLPEFLNTPFKQVESSIEGHLYFENMVSYINKINIGESE